MNKKNLVVRMLPYAVLAAALVLSVSAYALNGMHNLDSDMSSEMVLADLLNSEGRLMTGNWYYSTELRVVSPIPVYQLGLVLFPSWHAARTFSVAVLLIGVALSFLYMGRGAGMGEGAAYCAAAIVLPLSEAYAFVFTYGGFYTVYFMMTCWLIGLLLRLSDARRRKIRLMLLIAISVWGGMAGVRMPMLCGVPLLLACIAVLFGEARRSSCARQVLRGEQAAMAAGALAMIAGMAVGYVINVAVFRSAFHFDHYDDLALSPFSVVRLAEQVETIFPFFGYEDGIVLMSLQGIASLASVCIVGTMGLSVCLLLLHRGLRLDARPRLILMFALCAVAMGVVLNDVTDRTGSPYTHAYYLCGLLAMIACVYLLIWRVPSGIAALRSVTMLLFTAMFFLQACSFLGGRFSTQRQDYEEAAQWLSGSGYGSGFATYWNANVLTEASDGRLDVYACADWQDTEIAPWLQKTAHLEELPQGRVFVYVDADEAQGDVPVADDGHLVHSLESGARIYAYDSAQQAYDLMRSQSDAGIYLQ